MLTKDQMFAIHDFIYGNYGDKLWTRSEKLLDITRELSETEAQKTAINKFIHGNSNRIIADLESSVFSLFKNLINIKNESEIATVS